MEKWRLLRRKKDIAHQNSSEEVSTSPTVIPIPKEVFSFIGSQDVKATFGNWTIRRQGQEK